MYMIPMLNRLMKGGILFMTLRKKHLFVDHLLVLFRHLSSVPWNISNADYKCNMGKVIRIIFTKDRHRLLDLLFLVMEFKGCTEGGG